jgi:AAA domain
MNQHTRAFEDKPAVRDTVPLLIGLMGPSGGGKTYSALRLATGIQTVTGGDIYVIDTEAKRALHYADKFKFRHIEFGAPFGSLDYLEALRHCAGKGAGVIVVDSMSHEHESPGGMIDFHEKELDRMAGDDYAKRERVKMLAWQKPKAARRLLINGLLQLNANFIFCFRAKETAKPIKVGGKTEVAQQGFMPIAGEEFVFEQTVNCLLLPGAIGVPTWKSDFMGERKMTKLPEQFKDIFRESRALDEDIGKQLATWAKGGSSKTPGKTVQPAAQTGADFDEPSTTEKATAFDDALALAAETGVDALRAAWDAIPKDYRETLKAALDQRHKPAAAKADKAKAEAAAA